ncbi:hypothetical protein HUE46_03625 [Flavobacterium columnare]|uniref:hypothetical protein n=1 Tax=Flavobacterium columnare TaxID=996 RepID=UPI000981DB2A|nr:hypothetical protein [Flavobacterium columnare]OOB81752.1 hypothetical protein BZL53_13460 [Flavobacterium columnare]QOG89169.1 hypothetical protein HUE41_03625 [Flavobacterium columnare]QOG91828.1 hypothetical protein HUE42_03620 [Flavobacterium columnare]QOG94492.1 hypothetical protein HUE43_03625 [Flavobacterium columnare]QOG97151.1 hypothetical protein HUE44_03620 [Flavobacterium columnare]
MIYKEKLNFVKDFLSHSLKLLSSGLLTSIGFIVLASGGLNFIKSDIALQVILFAQYQMIGLTVCKFGVDNQLYASFLVDASKKYDPLCYMKNNGLYLALFFSLIIYFLEKDLLDSFLVFLLLILDVISILIIVQLGARRLFEQVFLSNFLSYPLFFIVFLILEFFMNLNKSEFILIFLLCSFIRFLITFKFYNQIVAIELNPKLEFKLGIQQLLNYILFKYDQIIFSLGTVSMIWFGYNSDELQKYLFLTRFPELISGVLVSLVFLYGSEMVVTKREDFLNHINKNRLAIIFYLFLLALFFFVYLFFWKGNSIITYYDVLPYFLISVMIIFVNMITLGMLKVKKVNNLNFNLFLSIFLSIIFQILLMFLEIKSIVLWSVPLQMLFFIVLILFKKK